MALTYNNGYVPTKLLITFKTGYTQGEGNWAHMTTPGSYAKHLALVALAKQNTGRTLEITDGWGAYRPYDSQVYARALYGNGAAWPGTSSHGMFWEGRQCAAYDYGNWSWVYNGDRAAFYRDVRAVGMEPGLIHPSRGNNYPDEPWHVVDLNPWSPAKSITPALPEEEDEDMKDKYCWYDADGKTINAIFNTVSGYFQEFESNGGAYNTAKARGHDVAGPSFKVSASDYQSIKNACAAVRTGKS